MQFTSLNTVPWNVNQTSQGVYEAAAEAHKHVLSYITWIKAVIFYLENQSSFPSSASF